MTQDQATKKLDPALVQLLSLCEKIGLSQAQQILLTDLAGWNNRGKGMPFSYDGIEPHVSIIANGAMLAFEKPDIKDRFIAQSIAELLTKIIGPQLMERAKLNPMKTFKSIGLSEWSSAWLVAQLGLEISKEAESLIRRMSSIDPERFLESDVVRATINFLLNIREKQGS